jgi:hypothetical protein
MLILSIPIPLLWQVRLPWKRKMALGLLLCSGLFVITAAIIRAVLTLGNASEVNNADIWGVRETFVSVIAISAPAIKPLFSPASWSKSGSSNSKDRFTQSNFSLQKTSQPSSHELSSVRWAEKPTGFDKTGAQRLADDGSEEFMVPISTYRTTSESDRKVQPLKIEVQTAYELDDGQDLRSNNLANAEEGRSSSNLQGITHSWNHGHSETRITGGGQ